MYKQFTNIELANVQLTQGSLNHKSYFDWLGVQLGCKDTDDWYNVTLSDIRKHGGGLLMSKHYGDSIVKALRSVYNGHSWNMWRFAPNSKLDWASKTTQRDFFDWLYDELGHKDKTDWYKVTADTVQKHSGAFLKKYYKNSVLLAVQ